MKESRERYPSSIVRNIFQSFSNSLTNKNNRGIFFDVLLFTRICYVLSVFPLKKKKKREKEEIKNKKIRIKRQIKINTKKGKAATFDEEKRKKEKRLIIIENKGIRKEKKRKETYLRTYDRCVASMKLTRRHFGSLDNE